MPVTNFLGAFMGKRTLVLGSVVLGGWLVAGVALQAHHSLAATYDMRKEGVVTGAILKVAFTNPHGAVHLEVKDADGKATEWIFTTGSANALSNLGFTRDIVKAGDVVQIRYLPARNGAPLGFIRGITLPDERQFEFNPD
jgi:hypothetical protein